MMSEGRTQQASGGQRIVHPSGPTGTRKREILWNVVQPGDPYDIRKSMIVKFPGDRQNFMGVNPEMACLLQAAEIQRLSEYLDEYKLRYRQLERRQLDRHYYEIQIKQLTEKLAAEDSHHTQNLKLKEYLKKLTAELSETRRKVSSQDFSLQAKYQDAIRQLQLAINENLALKQEKESILIHLNQLNAKYSALEAAHKREREDMRLRIQDKSALENEKRQFAHKYESQIYQLKSENRRIRDAHDLKMREIEGLQAKLREANIKIENLSSQSEEYNDMSRRLKEYESRFNMMTKQIDRLNISLREKTSEIEETKSLLKEDDAELSHQESIVRQLQQKVRDLEAENNQYSLKLQELKGQATKLTQSKSVIEEYEKRANTLSGEIERLKALLKAKIQENTTLLQKISSREFELKNIEPLRRENEELRRQHQELFDLRKKIVENQSRHSSMSLELERLNHLIRAKGEDSHYFQQQYKKSQQELEATRLQCRELENSISHDAQSKITLYEQRLTQREYQNEVLQRKLREIMEANQKLVEYQNQIGLLFQEVQRKNHLISQKTDEINNFDIRYKNLQNEIEEHRRRASEVENSLMYELKAKISAYEQKIVIYEQRIRSDDQRLAQTSQEIQRMNFLLKGKEEGEYNTELKFRNAAKEIEVKNRQLLEGQKRVIEYENKVALLAQEIERLNNNSKIKIDELAQSKNKNRALQHELEVAKRRFTEIEGSFSFEMQSKMAAFDQRINSVLIENKDLKGKLHELIEINRKIPEYENNIVKLTQEIERLNQALHLKNQDFKSLENRYRLGLQQQQAIRKKLSQFQTTVSSDFRSKVQQYQRRLHSVHQENEELKRKIKENSEGLRRGTELEQRLIQSSQESQRLRNELQVRLEQYSKSEKKARSLQQELENIKRRYNEIEKQLQESVMNSRGYENKLAYIDGENEELKRRLSELMRGKQEWSRLEVQRKTAQQNKIRRLEQEVQGYQQHLKSTEENHARKIVDYENQMNAMSREMEELAGQSESIYKENIGMGEKLSEFERFKHAFVALQEQANQVAYERDQLSKRLQQFQEANRKLQSTEARIPIMMQEIEKLKKTLKIKHEENAELQKKVQFFQRENDLQKRRITESDNKLAFFSQEIERLTSSTKGKMNESQNRIRVLENELENSRRRVSQLEGSISTQMQLRISAYEQRYTAAVRENDELKKKIDELRESNRKISEYESKLQKFMQETSKLSQEGQQLNRIIKEKNQEIEHSENRSRELEVIVREIQARARESESKGRYAEQELEGARRKIAEYENTINYEYQPRIQSGDQKLSMAIKENEELKRRIIELTHLESLLQENESKRMLMSRELEKVNNALRLKGEEVGMMDLKLKQGQKEYENWRQRESELERNLLELQSRANASQQKMNQISLQNEELRKRYQLLNENERYLEECKNKLRIVSQEKERINELLHLRGEELKNSEEKVRMMQIQFEKARRHISQLQNKINMEYQPKMNNYDQALQHARRENQDLQRRITDESELQRMIMERENRIGLLGQEVERFKQALKEKNDEAHRLEASNRGLIQEHEVLRRRAGEVENIQIEMQNRIIAYEQRISSYEQRMVLSAQQADEARRKLAETIKKLADYQNKIERLNSALKEQSEKLLANVSEIQGARRKQHQYVAEIERLNISVANLQRLQGSHKELMIKLQEYKGIIHQKQGQYQRLQHEHASKNAENEKHLLEYEASIKKLSEEFERMQDLKSENIRLKHELKGTGGVAEKNRMLAAEIERLTKLIAVQNQEIAQLRIRMSDEVALQKRISEHMALVVILFAQIESLRKRVKDKEKEVDEVRRYSLASLTV